MSPQGERFTQEKAKELAGESHLAIVCGRYEGVDQRAVELAIDEEISIGDYVLSGGEAAAMVVIEAISRFVPGVLGNPESTQMESFQQGGLEGPQYTRPAEYRGLAVPEVLRSGDHAKIARWRAEQALARTKTRRPDLLSPSAEGEER
jgi:tRNA (guanine37-N1)-methyltransferase